MPDIMLEMRLLVDIYDDIQKSITAQSMSVASTQASSSTRMQQRTCQHAGTTAVRVALVALGLGLMMKGVCPCRRCWWCKRGGAMLLHKLHVHLQVIQIRI